jgi:hypothetical protein
MYKDTYIRVKKLFINPDKEWESINREKMTIRDIFFSYNMPLIIISTIAVFIGSLFNYHEARLDNAFTHASYTFIAFMVSLATAYLIMLKLISALNIKSDKETIFKLIALPSLLIYITHLVVTLFPEIFFIRLLNLYAGFIIWEGYRHLFNVDKQKNVLLSFITSAFVLLLPLGVFQILYSITGL